MKVFSNLPNLLLDNLLKVVLSLLVAGLVGFVVRRWLRFRQLRRHYEAALKKAAEGKKEWAYAAIQILREGFFDKFVKPKGISPEKEFTEFLRLLRERLPQVEGLEKFLEDAYDVLATDLEGDEKWKDRSNKIAEFLQRRREEPKEALREEQPIVPVTSHFTLIPNHKNFLDRQSELEQLRAWLKDEKATVGVLVGIGGQGKTYLAAKFAEECQQNGWQVRWAKQPLTTDEFLLSIAYEMKQRNDHRASVVNDPKQQPEVRWNKALRFLDEQPERWLIVLDDFQKTTDPTWKELLQFFDEQCKRTKVLVTTRKELEALRAHQIFDVPELPKEVAQDYLRAVGLSMDEATAVRIWEKCEGNPKAMKLFAQAARRRSIERVLALPLPAWYEDATRWMDELLADLSKPAKEVAKRLSIFDEPVEEPLLFAIGATEKGLWELQDFRLAEKTEDERWQEHDLLREYWQTRLSDQERRDWYRKAGEWLRQQAENLRAAQSERNPEAWSLELQMTWVSYLRRAFWHFVAAREAQPRQWWKRLWQRLFANARETQLTLQTASPITSFLHRWGEWDELLRLCQKSLQLAKESGDEKAVADWTHRLAIRFHYRGDYEEAERLYRESLEICERLGNLAGKAATLQALGRLVQNRGDYEEAGRLYQQCLEIWDQLFQEKSKIWERFNLAERAATLRELVRSVQERCDYEEVGLLFQESVKMAERLGNFEGKAVTLHALGVLAQKQGNYKKAEQLYRESLEICERLTDLAGKAATLHMLGWLAHDRGDYGEAERLYRESLKIFERLGDLVGKAATLHQLGILAHDLHAYEKAKQLYQKSLEIWEQLRSLRGKAYILHQLGMLAYNQSNYEEAERLYQKSLGIKEQLKDLKGKAVTLHALGVLAQKQGNYKKAEQLYQESLGIWELLEDLEGKAVTLYQLGKLRWAQGRKAEAEELLRQALDILERIGHRRAEEVRKDLERLQSESA
jgi:tetratricopeptide (TPR) repeat protein